jgi:hypothetical protein
MLSEKAKGKQRAVDVVTSGDGEESASEVRNLVVRFSEGISDLIIPLRKGQKIGDIKKLVRSSSSRHVHMPFIVCRSGS